MPYRRIRTGENGVPLQGQEDGKGCAGQHPASLAQPHPVGDQHQGSPGTWPLPEPPEPLGEAGAIGSEALPDQGQRPAVRKCETGVGGRRSEEADADGKRRCWTLRLPAGR